MGEINEIRVVRPDQFDLGTARHRALSAAPEVGVTSAMWGGIFEVKSGSRTEILHHGDQETITFLLFGACEIRWGPKGEFSALAKQGDFIHVPAHLAHMEINQSKVHPFRRLVLRSTPTPIVVNLPENVWP